MAKRTLYAAATVAVVLLVGWALGSKQASKSEASAESDSSTESTAVGRVGFTSEGASAAGQEHAGGAARAQGSSTTQPGAALPVAVAANAADPASPQEAAQGRAEEGDEGTGEESEKDLTPDQVKVLTMYEGMAKTLAAQAGCDDIGNSLNALVEQHAASVKGWASAQAAQGAEGAQVEQQLLEEAAPRRLKRLRDGIKQGLMRCGADPKVNTAIAKLASLSNGA